VHHESENEAIRVLS